MSFYRIISNSVIRNPGARLLVQSACVPRKRFRCVAVAPNQTRSISVCACHCANRDSNARTEDEKSNDKLEDQPIRYSTSKATKWTVNDSFGVKEKPANPMWRVVLISSVILVFLGWAFIRKESEIDRMLEKDLYQQFEEKYPNYRAPGKDKRL
ncbi:ubiquinol-cytochrome c reductase complex assembly factor 4-like [Amphiura filiformis]|uniref:ubiquinol-cytochrome c reductase complex assembly factor 4-like n=1 Tax=Amphiura filiformis TaxID=82378 RepID=UPI003B21B88E